MDPVVSKYATHSNYVSKRSVFAQHRQHVSRLRTKHTGLKDAVQKISQRPNWGIERCTVLESLAKQTAICEQ